MLCSLKNFDCKCMLQEYLMADRNMSIIPVGFSLMASFMSAITLLGVSMENYSFGTQFVIINVSYGIGTPIAAYGFLPVFYKLQATSAYEYLERRFGVVTRLAASFAFSLQMILYMGIVLYAPALALSAVTGISQLGALLSVGIVCTFYSTIGGMKAVLITDVFQSLLMFAAIFSVIVKGTIDAGGLYNVWKRAEEGGRIEFFNFNPDPTVRHTVWSLVIGGMFTFLSLYAVNQAQVQRLLTVRSLRRSQQALWLNWPILTCLSFSTSFTGLILPLFVMDSMGHIPGLAGLFVAGIFSGSLSTVSSAVNSLAAVTMEDYIKPMLVHKECIPWSDKTNAVASKILALFFGILCIGMAFVAENLGGVLQASLTIFGVVGGPLFGLFTLGMFFWIANETGALCGLASGLMVGLWIGFGGPKPPPPFLPTTTEGCNTTTMSSVFLNQTYEASSMIEKEDYFILYKLSYLWFVVICFFVTLIVGILASVIQQKVKPLNQAPLDPNLLSPLIKRFIPVNSAMFLQVATVDLNKGNFDSMNEASVNTTVTAL
ncbi:hypothetical protein B566_EDAN009224 [Ephemera danica]|nr:hypothetical protein B566_EDAN009224 [Ephemera danica]